MSTEPVTQPCRYCGKPLPQEAIFCYYCHRELVTRPERPSVPEKSLQIKWWVWLLATAVVAVLVLLLT